MKESEFSSLISSKIDNKQAELRSHVLLSIRDIIISSMDNIEVYEDRFMKPQTLVVHDIMYRKRHGVLIWLNSDLIETLSPYGYKCFPLNNPDSINHVVEMVRNMFGDVRVTMIDRLIISLKRCLRHFGISVKLI